MLSIFNLSPTQKTCLFTYGNKANVSASPGGVRGAGAGLLLLLPCWMSAASDPAAASTDLSWPFSPAQLQQPILHPPQRIRPAPPIRPQQPIPQPSHSDSLQEQPISPQLSPLASPLFPPQQQQPLPNSPSPPSLQPILPPFLPQARLQLKRTLHTHTPLPPSSPTPSPLTNQHNHNHTSCCHHQFQGFPFAEFFPLVAGWCPGSGIPHLLSHASYCLLLTRPMSHRQRSSGRCRAALVLSPPTSGLSLLLCASRARPGGGCTKGRAVGRGGGGWSRAGGERGTGAHRRCLLPLRRLQFPGKDWTTDPVAVSGATWQTVSDLGIKIQAWKRSGPTLTAYRPAGWPRGTGGAEYLLPQLNASTAGHMYTAGRTCGCSWLSQDPPVILRMLCSIAVSGAKWPTVSDLGRRKSRPAGPSGAHRSSTCWSSRTHLMLDRITLHLRACACLTRAGR